MKRVAPILGLLGVALVASPASADNTGRTGKIVSLQINGEGSDDISLQQGMMEVKVVFNQGGNRRTRIEKYVWGGTNCSNRGLTDTQVQNLTMAMAAFMKVAPKWKPGQLQGSRCLVAFKLKRRANQDHD